MENSHERRWFVRTNIILRSCLFGLHSKRVYNKEWHCDELQGYVRIKDFCRGYRKIVRNNSVGKLWCRNDIIIVLWHGRSRKEMRRKMLRICQQNDWAIFQSRMHGWPQFKEEENGSVGELCTVCSQIVLKCLYLARIGRLDSIWTVNKLARAVTKWTKACDKHLGRLISCSHHTCEYRQYCCVGNTAQHCRLGLFQDSGFAGDLEDSKSPSGGILCIFGSRTFVSRSWTCKKQTSVSHSSTEAEVISLNAGLRMDGIPALDFWDWVIEVFHSLPNQTNKTKDVREPRGNLSVTPQSNMRQQIPATQKISIWPILVTFHQAEHILVPMLCCMSLRTMKPWSRW